MVYGSVFLGITLDVYGEVFGAGTPPFVAEGPPLFLSDPVSPESSLSAGAKALSAGFSAQAPTTSNPITT